jgi:uncharacterized membrane protein
MVALIFLSVIAAVFVAVVALEGGDASLERRPKGLLTWIASGNWPAKIGGALIVVGVGALLRYAAINFDVPPVFKLALGIAASAGLGFASFLTSAIPQRRVISLALGGAAFGVAYLTAYSAFALFGYLPSMQGLGLLVLTAVGAGVFAVSRSALSLAVLSMVGAFIAPAFAIDDPGPGVVYGYYVAASVLTLAMVAVRGWRPLIHLSFLFTLAGSAFFAWTAGYFAPGNSAVMFPLLAMLVAVHVAMPIVERRWSRGRVVESLDTVYLLALPVVAALTAQVLAPSRAVLAVQLWWYAGIWLAAAAWLYSQRREGMATHAIIGLLMLGCGLAARFRDLPWELVGLGIAVIALVFAARRSESKRLQGFLAGLVLVLAAIHMISALAPAPDSTLFLNQRFAERIIGAGLMLVAALTLTRLRHTLDSLMLTIAIGWAAFAIGAEIVRLDLVSAWLIAHWLLVLVGFASYFAAARVPVLERLIVPLVLAIGFSAVLAQMKSSAELSWVSAFFAGLSLLAIALRPVRENESSASGRPLAAIGAPIVVALWVGRVAHLAADAPWQFPLAVAAAAAIVVLLAGYRAAGRSAGWFSEATDMFAMGFTFVLSAAAIFDIERDAAAVVLELLCVGALVLIACWNDDRVRVGHWILPATVIGVAAVLQANLLRWLGPPGDLNALDVARMNWPTLVSLLWASIGAALTIWARRVGSRVTWSAGAAFLVGAAIKLLLLDFGSLGDLANILAVIAAGGVFLLVGWLAPMPPAAEKPPEPAAPARPAWSRETGWRPISEPTEPDHKPKSRLAWTVAIAAAVLFTVSHCRARYLTERIDAQFPVERQAEPPVPAVAAAASVAASAAERARYGEQSRESECTRWVSRLPPDYEVHVVTADGHHSMSDWRQILVDVQGRNVVLVLATPEVATWNIRWTEESDLAGIWLINRTYQVVKGVRDDVPILNAMMTDDACANAAAQSETPPFVDGITRVVGRVPVSFNQVHKTWVRVGTQLNPADADYEPLPAEDGLRELLQTHAIRKADERDIAEYNEFANGKGMRTLPEPVEGGSFRETFVVNESIRIPAGLTGSHAVAFLVPDGIPQPAGRPGGSLILDMNH